MTATRKKRIPMSEQIRLINECRSTAWLMLTGAGNTIQHQAPLIIGSTDTVRLQPIRSPLLPMGIAKTLDPRGEVVDVNYEKQLPQLFLIP